MSDDLNKIMTDLQDLVMKSLPAIQAESLRKFISQAQEDKKNLESAKLTIQVMTTENKNIITENQRLHALELSALDIKAGTEELRIAKLDFDITKKLKDSDLTHANDKVSLVQNMFNKVFDNIQAKRFVYETKNLVIPQGSYPQQVNNNKTETHEEG